MTDENLERFIGAAAATGPAPSLPVPIQSLTDSAQIDRWFNEKNMLSFSLRESAPAGLVVDVLVRPSVPFAELRSAAAVNTLGGAHIPVASVTHPRAGPFETMSASLTDGMRPAPEWTAEQVMAWMDSFRELILNTAEGNDAYERLRRADPLRQVHSPAAAE